MIRVMIVDDEQPARDRLRRLLGGCDDIQIIGMAEMVKKRSTSLASSGPTRLA